MDYQYRFATVGSDLDFWKTLNKETLHVHPAASGDYTLQKPSLQIDKACLFRLLAQILAWEWKFDWQYSKSKQTRAGYNIGIFFFCHLTVFDQSYYGVPV